MKRKALTFVLFVVSFCVSNLATNPAVAAEYYIRRTPLHDGLCTKEGFSTHETFAWSVPTGDIKVHSISSMNGRVFANESFIALLPSTTGSTVGVFTSFASYPFPQEFPYTVSIFQTWSAKRV